MAMETINHLINFAELMFERWPFQDASTSLVAGVIILSAFFIIPNRSAQVFGAIALAGLGILILLAQNHELFPFVLWCGLFGVVYSQRRSAALQKQLTLLQNKLDKMSRVVQQLELAESCRMIESLNSSSRAESRNCQPDAPSIMPSEKIDGLED